MLVIEKVDIFVYTLAMVASNRNVGEHFRHFNKIISGSLHEVLEAISSKSNGYKGLAHDMIK